jgi:large subunit ribosomal protein L30
MADQNQRKTITVTQVRSTIGFNRKQTDLIRSLGLLRIRHTVVVNDTPEMRGIIHKVRHLVTIEK